MTQHVYTFVLGTSKSGNSEVYVVCLTFIGREEIPSSVMEKLFEGYGEHCPSSSLFSLSTIPSMFLERLRACEEYFATLQMEAIDHNIQQFYYMSSREWKARAQLRELVVENFVERFHLKPINKEEHVVPGAHLDGTQLSFTRGPTNNVPFRESFNGRHQMGSYNERNENLNQDWLEKTLADGQFQFHPTQLRSLQGTWVQGFACAPSCLLLLSIICVLRRWLYVCNLLHACVNLIYRAHAHSSYTSTKLS